jgi:hypothetical protein
VTPGTGQIIGPRVDQFRVERPFDITSGGGIRGTAGSSAILIPSLAGVVDAGQVSQELVRLNQPDDVSRSVTVQINAQLATGVAQVVDAIPCAQAVLQWGTENGSCAGTLLDIRHGAIATVSASFFTVVASVVSRDVIPTSGIVEVQASLSENPRAGGLPNSITQRGTAIADGGNVRFAIPNQAWGVQVLRSPVPTTDCLVRFTAPPFGAPQILGEFRPGTALGQSFGTNLLTVPAPASHVEVLNTSGGGVVIDSVVVSFYLNV